MEMNFREIVREVGGGPLSGFVTGFWVDGFTCGRSTKNSIAVR
jgi:uncharacterized membrane protein (Fun14 family)